MTHCKYCIKISPKLIQLLEMQYILILLLIQTDLPWKAMEKERYMSLFNPILSIKGQ